MAHATTADEPGAMRLLSVLLWLSGTGAAYLAHVRSRQGRPARPLVALAVASFAAALLLGAPRAVPSGLLWLAAVAGVYFAYGRSRRGHDARPLLAVSMLAALAAVVVGIALR